MFGLFRTILLTLCTCLKTEILTDEVELQEELLHTFNIETTGVVAVVVLNLSHIFVAFGEELVVVERAVVGRNAVEVAHVDGLCHLLTGDEGLIELLAMACTDDLDFGLTVLRIELGVSLLEELGTVPLSAFRRNKRGLKTVPISPPAG